VTVPRSTSPILVAALLVLTAAATGSPASAQSPTPGDDAGPLPFPLYGLGRVGYAMPDWTRDPTGYAVFHSPTGGGAVYSVVMPDPALTLAERLAARTAATGNESDRATDIDSAVIEGVASRRPIGRVVRTVPMDPPSVLADYLFSTCPDGSAVEITFSEPESAGDVAGDLAVWDSVATVVEPCHPDYRIVPAGTTSAGAAARLGRALRSWERRIVQQWMALRDMPTTGKPVSRAQVARARVIRANIERIDRAALADIHDLFPTPFAMAPTVVEQAVAGFTVSSVLDRLDPTRTAADVRALEAAVDDSVGAWQEGVQEATRALGLDGPTEAELQATWGPLAVVDDPAIGGLDAGMGSGRLVIGERCVYLQGQDPASRTTLIWRSGQTRWDRQRRQIVYHDRDMGRIRLSDGDRMTLGGYGIGTADRPDNVEVPIGPWISEPDASCPADRFVAEQVDFAQ
jgi:hypothetical protein